MTPIQKVAALKKAIKKDVERLQQALLKAHTHRTLARSMDENTDHIERAIDLMEKQKAEWERLLKI